MSADIEAIRARLARAARGPWDIATATDGTGDTGITTQIEDKTCVIAEVFSQVSGRGKDSWRCIHTAKFIAHAPADIAALLAEVERLCAVRDAAKQLYAVVRDRLDADQTLVLYRLVAALDAAEEAK